MKALVSLICIAVLIGGVYMISTGGCTPQAQVAGDKVMEKINSWLGELDVKRKEISIEIDKLDSAVENVRRKSKPGSAWSNTKNGLPRYGPGSARSRKHWLASNPTSRPKKTSKSTASPTHRRLSAKASICCWTNTNR